MEEIFVLYEKETGFIKGTGKIDRELDQATQDGSTMSERISVILEEDPLTEVLFMLNETVPDPTQHKVKYGKIVDLTEEDKALIESTQPKSEIELLKERVKALEDMLNVKER